VHAAPQGAGIRMAAGEKVRRGGATPPWRRAREAGGEKRDRRKGGVVMVWGCSRQHVERERKGTGSEGGGGVSLHECRKRRKTSEWKGGVWAPELGNPAVRHPFYRGREKEGGRSKKRKLGAKIPPGGGSRRRKKGWGRVERCCKGK